MSHERFCPACLNVDHPAAEHCSNCGGTAFAEMSKHGHLLSVPAASAMPCTHCGERGHELKLRYYRRVIGMVIVDQITSERGYYCKRCRGVRFRANMGSTLVLGWWGIAAALARNPWAIGVNLWACFRPPFASARQGAIEVADVRRA
jgi:hypothetical protein